MTLRTKTEHRLIRPPRIGQAVSLHGETGPAHVGHPADEAARCVPQIRIRLNHHNALSDATACARIVMRAVKAGIDPMRLVDAKKAKWTDNAPDR